MYGPCCHSPLLSVSSGADDRPFAEGVLTFSPQPDRTRVHSQMNVVKASKRPGMGTGAGRFAVKVVPDGGIVYVGPAMISGRSEVKRKWDEKVG